MHPANPAVLLATLLVAQLLTADHAAAQCGLSLQPAAGGDALSTPRGSVYASTYWDPDGAGPLPVCLVVGGMFAVANSRFSAVAFYDGATWTSLGYFGETPIVEDVPCVALTVHNGDLVAATGTRVYLRTGGSWQTLGYAAFNPLDRVIDVLASHQGSIYVGGSFDWMTANLGTPQTGRGIARWNGASWSAVGGANPAGFAVRALASVANRLFAGGSFTSIGGVAASYLAAWDGTTWAPFGSPNGSVTALGVRNGLSTTSTYLFAAGSFTQIGGVAASRFARVPVAVVGASWAPMDGLPQSPSRMSVRSIGLSGYECLAAAGTSLHRWNGASWDVEFALANTFVGTIGSYNGVAFGTIRRDVSFGHTMERAIACADGTTLHGQGVAGDVLAVADWNGQRVIAGDFQRIGTTVVNGIASGGPGAWQPIGNGLTGGVGRVRALVADGSLLYAAGEFALATGGVADGVAVWNGSSWQQLGAGLNGPVRALVRGPNGYLYAGGSFTASGAAAVRGLARYNGSVWQVDSGGLDGNATTAVVDHLAMAGTDLYIAGSFTTAGSLNVVVNNFVRHDTLSANNGTSWQPLTVTGSATPGVGVVRALASTADGVLVAHAPGANPVWTELGEVVGASITPYAATPNTTMRATEVDAIVAAPGRTFLVARGVFEHRNGTTLLFTSTADLISISPASIAGLADFVVTKDAKVGGAAAADGSVLFGGTVRCGGSGATEFAQSGFLGLVPQCPATAVAFGTPCGSGSSGAVPSQSVEALPWIGSTCRIATNSITGSVLNLAIAAIGVQQVAVPLAAILPVGGPCDLLVDPIVTLGLTPTFGAVRHEFAVPYAPSLIGQQLLDQVVRVDFGFNGIDGLGASQALRLTIGSLY